MGNCSGSPANECSPLPPLVSYPDPPSSDRKQIYDHLRIILCESYDIVNELQEAFVSTNLYHCFPIILIKFSFHGFKFQIAFFEKKCIIFNSFLESI